MTSMTQGSQALNNRGRDNLRRVPSDMVNISEYMRLRQERQHERPEPCQYFTDWQMGNSDPITGDSDSDHDYYPDWLPNSASKQT